jgi:hypothetical protein
MRRLPASTSVTSAPASAGTKLLPLPEPPHADARIAPPNIVPNTNAQAFIASPLFDANEKPLAAPGTVVVHERSTHVLRLAVPYDIWRASATPPLDSRGGPLLGGVVVACASLQESDGGKDVRPRARRGRLAR